MEQSFTVHAQLLMATGTFTIPHLRQDTSVTGSVAHWLGNWLSSGGKYAKMW